MGPPASSAPSSLRARSRRSCGSAERVDVAPRVVAEDFELDGYRLVAELSLSLSTGSANHDPVAYDRPHDFDITAEREPQLTFGGGPHYCLGANLARAEMQEALPILAARMPRPRGSTASPPGVPRSGSSARRRCRSVSRRHDRGHRDPALEGGRGHGHERRRGPDRPHPARVLLPRGDTRGGGRATRGSFPTTRTREGNISLRVQAFVIEHDGSNGARRPVRRQRQVTPAAVLERAVVAVPRAPRRGGHAPESIDLVVHTHLHADHVGWDTRLVDGDVGTDVHRRASPLHRTRARLQSQRRRPGHGGRVRRLDQTDRRRGPRRRRRRGRRPGRRLAARADHRAHARPRLALDRVGRRRRADHRRLLHHPVQLAEPAWAEIGDADADEARATRRRMLARAAETGALVLGTHFGTRPAGRVVGDGDVWRFVSA